jgi:DNA-binding protein Alba
MAQEKSKEAPIVAPKVDYFVKIGKKPAMNYILAAMTQFSSGAKKITIQARGSAIITAVNVTEAVKRRVPVKEPIIKIGTEEVMDQRTNRQIKVSVMDIVLELNHDK